MKKIFFALVAAFGLWSCVQEELPVVGGNNTVVGEGEVVVEGSIVVPEVQDATRAFGNEAITKLDILVFDENGYLIQDTAGTADSFGVTKDTEYKFKVKLGQSSYKRTIHFVAYNGNNMSFSYSLGQHMRYVVDMLATTDGNEAFWGVVELPNGITGNKKGDVFVPTAPLQTALTRVPLVRNYAHITLTNNASAYLADAEIMMYNIPDKGSVVARITDSNYAQFATRAGDTPETVTNTEKTYTAISADYDGYEPADMTLGNSDWGTSLYMYERHQQSGGNSVNSAAFAIVRGKYVSSTGTDADYTYYKIDLCYADENNKVVLYNLLRNMRYNIILNSVSGRGAATAEEAAAGAAANNVNFADVTIDLSNISDGERRLSVEYTSRVLTSGNTEYTLKYKYETNIATGATNNGAVVFSGHEGGDVIASSSQGTTNDGDGWSTFTYTTKAITGTKIQDVILTAGNLQRRVHLILGNPYQFTLDVATKIADAVGTKLPAKLILPTGLPDAMFPLEFYVISANNSLTSSLPVKTGLSSEAVPTDGGKYFGYVVTVEADDYFVYDDKGDRVEDQYNNEISIDLKTNMTGAAPSYPGSDNGTGTLVTAYNPYFISATDRFYVGTPYGLRLTISSFSATSATATFNINTNNQSIAAEDWSTDSSNNKYFDFDFIFSNSSVALTGATFSGITDAQKDYVKVVDGNTLRIYKNIYDAGIRNFTLTFTSSSSVMDTTITAEHMAFGSASATIEKLAIAWSLGTFSATSGNQQTLAITMPQNVPSSAFPITLTIKVEALTRTNLRINNSSNLSVNGSVTIQVTEANYNSSRTINVPLVATRTQSTQSANFTISLTTNHTDLFTNPANITKNKDSDSYNYE